ncbi:MAG: hypothetical protein KatS3mg003_1360 [Candidatus Nitrosocaldaceae archaeon]|nr:MAG: hypothetical protein KatS3mg003_1360 [Candidatus Nitrosocaldaceae archaeon]
MNTIHAELSIIPIGTGSTSLGRYIAIVIDAIRKEGIDCNITPMGTLIESNDIDVIFNAINKAREALFNEGIKRVEIILRIDERLDKPRSMEDKVISVEKYLRELE